MTLDLQTWPCAPSLLPFGAAPRTRAVPRICSRTSTGRLAAPLSPPQCPGLSLPNSLGPAGAGGSCSFPIPREGKGAPLPATS